MKRKLMITAIATFAILATTSTTVAQITTPLPGMPLSLSIAQEGIVSNSPTPARVNIRAIRDFSKRFNGRDAIWYQAGNVFIGKYSEDSIRTVAGYTKHGRWIYTIRHYGEHEMPGNLRHIVKSQYYDYNIELINEVRIPGNKSEIYLIHLANAKGEHTLLRYSDVGIEVVNTFYEKV